MSKAYKCDRCGMYFDKVDFDPERDYVINPGTRYVIFTAPHENLDLCNECYNKLVQFLEDPGSDVYS